MDIERAVKYNKDHFNLWVTLKPDDIARMVGGWEQLTNIVCQYQVSNGLEPDGMLGPKTIYSLQLPGMPGASTVGDNITVSVPSWYTIAMAEIGTREFQPGSNPQIEKYHASTSLGSSPDDVPWCSSFVNWCIEQAGIKGTGSAWARSWLKWGEDLSTPRLGCIVVFSRGEGGHVAFYSGGGTAGKINVLGGNQSNQVRFSFYNQDDVLGYRWPWGYQK